MVTEADEANLTVSKYDYGFDQLVRLDNNTEGESFFHLDILGSTVSLTELPGSTRQSILYDAWGKERERVGASANRFTFTGHEKDEEAGLIYAKARFYDPDIGRFLNQDSHLGDVANAPSLHRYAYANSNPTVFVDPLGLASVVAQDINTIRAQLATYKKEEGQEFSEGTVADQTGNVRAAPSRALVLLLEQYRTTEHAHGAIRDLVKRGASHVAFMVFEESDFNQNNRLIGSKVLGDLLGEVGTFAEDLPGLSDELLHEIGDVVSAGDARNISESFNAGFAYSANQAERQLDHLIDSFVELRNDQGPEMWQLRFSTRENTKSTVRYPYLSILAFQGRAPREFKYSATTKSAQQVFLFALTHRSLRRGTPNRIRQGGAYKDLTGNGGQIHHVPANSTTHLSTGRGPGIRMSTQDHRRTASWGSSREAKAFRARQKQLVEQGRFREAQQMDIDDIRSKFGTKYNDAIDEMLEYSESLPAADLTSKGGN